MVRVVVSRHITIKPTLFVFNLAFDTNRVCASSVCVAGSDSFPLVTFPLTTQVSTVVKEVLTKGDLSSRLALHNVTMAGAHENHCKAGTASVSNTLLRQCSKAETKHQQVQGRMKTTAELGLQVRLTRCCGMLQSKQICRPVHHWKITLVMPCTDQLSALTEVTVPGLNNPTTTGHQSPLKAAASVEEQGLLEQRGLLVAAAAGDGEW